MNDSADSTSPGVRKRPLRLFLTAGAVLIIAVGWYAWHRHSANAKAEGDYIFATIGRGDIEDLVTATGALQPRDYVDVGAQVSGQVERILVQVGDEVKKGDTLVEIDATQSEARVEANRANLRSQESQLADRQNTLVKAERDYQRQQNLKKEDATTDEAMQNAETTLISARQAISTLKAQIEQQRASMRVEEQNLRYTKIVAPMNGTVVSITAKQGQTLNATQQAPTLLRIADLSTMNVQTQVSEADVAKISKGMRAYFTTLGNQNRRWYGNLSRIEPTPTVQNNVVLYNALFEVKNEGNQLLPQMTAQVFFVRAEAHGVVVVPMAALQQGQQISREQAEKNKKPDDAKPAGTAAPAPANGAGANGAATARPGAPAVPPGAPAVAAGNAPAPVPGPGSRPGGGNGGPPGGFGGGFGGFGGNGPPTPEQIEQFRRMREQRGAQGGGGFGGGFGGQRPTNQVRPRNGTVMVRMADGKLQARAVVVGVTNRVHGEVLSGLKEGEEVVAGKHEAEAKAAGASSNTGFPAGGFPPGGFPGGGFPGGGFPGGGGGGGGGNRGGGGGR